MRIVDLSLTYALAQAHTHTYTQEQKLCLLKKETIGHSPYKGHPKRTPGSSQ